MARCDAGRWDAAVDTYAGEFLEGFEVGEPAFDHWADAERVQLRARFRAALLNAGQAAAAAGRASDSLEYARRLCETAPFDEEAALFEANTLVAAGRSAQAVSALLQFGRRLSDELDLPLPAASRTLLERLEKRGARTPTPSAASPTERGRSLAFIGRSAELSRMLAIAAGLRSERGATILIEGPAGIGKSRLLDEFVDRVRNLGGVGVLRGREAGLGSVVPYASVAEALRPLARAHGVAGASRHLLAEAARLLPELRDAFELPDVRPIEDETGKLRFFEGIAALIDAAAYEKATCLLIDDAQLASPSTVDLLIYLSRRLRQSPVLLVIAFRSDRAAAHGIERLRDLGSMDGDDALVSLSPLAPEESEALAAQAARGSSRLDAADIARIARLSNGRPFAILDLVQRALAGDTPSEAPATLRDVLWGRFQVASPSQRRVFFAVSLFERGASLQLLAAAAHLPEAAAYEAVQALVDNGLLRSTESGLTLAHDSTTSFLVESSGIAGRALLAGWAADALASAPDRTDAELAALFAMAGRGADAFVHARAGAFSAATVGAAAEVSRLLGMALTFAPNDEARGEIESLLAAFGRTRLSLPAPRAEDLTEAPAPADAPVDPKPIPGARAPRTRWEVGTFAQWALSIMVSLIVVIAGLAARRAILNRRVTGGITDTLYVEERDARGGTALRMNVQAAAHGDQEPGVAPSGALWPSWSDSLRPPFASPLASPDGHRVALRRATHRGDEVFVISSDRRDTIAIANSGGDNAPLGWSPDGRVLLVAHTQTVSGESPRPGLFAYTVGSSAPPLALDTLSSHSVVEAAWSPTGAWVAWVARVAPSRQREVFISRADGSEARNLSSNPNDDFAIDWSPDASLLAFVSTRGGGPRIYVYDFENARLWRVSDRSDESHPMFSPDGRTIAFESTRDGDLGVYVRPALGGTARRLTPRGRQFSLVAWRGAPPSYVDRLRIVSPAFVRLGDSLKLSVLSIAGEGRSIPSGNTRWSLVDAGPLSLVLSDSNGASVVGRGVGQARVAVAIPGWRTDTLAIAVASPSALDVQDEFDGAVLDSRWMPLGTPAPFTAKIAGGGALFPNGDLEWESGVLLRQSAELRPGLRFRIRVLTPSTSANNATVTIGFITATPAAAIDHNAPRFAPMLGVQWDGSAGTFSYIVGAERQSDPVSVTAAGAHDLEMEITPDRQVVFSLDDRERWRSSLTYVGGAQGTPVQLWIGGRATGRTIALTNLHLQMPPRAH